MRKLGSLQAMEVMNDIDAPWVILFHGYGADASDLHSLADFIPVNGPVNYLFPQGNLEVPIGPGWTGRAWWNIDMAAIQRDAAAGVERDTSDQIPTGLPKARELALGLINRLGVPWNKVILGGFSQGAMLAVDVALHAPENPAGLAILSGSLVNKVEWASKAPARAGLEFFQCHGKSDSVLPFKNAQRLETLLTQAGLKGRLQGFAGAHEIPPDSVRQLGAYIQKRLG